MNAIVVLEKHGQVLFSQKSPHDPLVMHFDLHGFEPYATHAIHIHEFGDLRKGCASLGGHFNPTQEKHSKHAGDLFHNFQTDKYGDFINTYKTKKISLFYNSRCVLGRSIVIHVFEDDYGMNGVTIQDHFIPYEQMTIQELTYLSSKLGYPISSRENMLRKLIRESETTGNASTRIDCGIIALTI